MNAAIDDCSIGNLGVVVMDEVHFINDESRGYILELMSTKLLSLEQGVQIVGMSATLDVSLARVSRSFYTPVRLTKHRMQICSQDGSMMQNFTFPSTELFP